MKTLFMDLLSALIKFILDLLQSLLGGA